MVVTATRPNGESTSSAKPTNTAKKTDTAAWSEPYATIKPASLFDVMNEELQKLSINKPSPKVIDKSPVKSPSKAWSSIGPTHRSSTMSPTGAKTMAEIIQMEQKFKEQYHKLTNRNMDLIQLEEKAIEDLKVLYNVHNSFDMQITIDFENDKDYDVLSTCAPIWKKVRI
jgi:hypothetical protein